jgi:hypothetical protein
VTWGDLIDVSKLFDGLLFAAGMGLLWLGAVLGASIVRSLGAAGGGGLVFAGKYLLGRRQYDRGDQSNIVNITLNTTRGGTLAVDTVVADRTLLDVYPNVYHVARLRAMARLCTHGNPLVCFPARTNGSRDEYRAIYDPLISLIAEACTNSNSIDLALGRPMREHRFVVALTFEKLLGTRSQHFRALMMSEAEVAKFPDHLDTSRWAPELVARFETLRSVARMYREHPARFGIVKVWRATDRYEDRE